MGIETMTKKISKSDQYESGESSDFSVMTKKISSSEQYEIGTHGMPGDLKN